MKAQRRVCMCREMKIGELIANAMEKVGKEGTQSILLLSII